MLKADSFAKEITLLSDEKTLKKVQLNLRRNKAQDNTEELDQLAKDFNYQDCKDEYWNPIEFSLLYGTPLWDQASEAQKLHLNHLYWVGYYSQIVSAEIATIYLNQASAAGLFGIEDFRIVCDTLDLESSQERAHINAFKTIAEAVEKELFGKRIFTFNMKPYFSETMIFQNTNKYKEAWKKYQLQFFSLLSSSNAFLASQYLTVRGLRTLNGKIVQHQLSQYYTKHTNQDAAPIPAKVSYHHFLDESYHFNSSTIIGHDISRILKEPTNFEKMVTNMAVKGCQRDHFNFNCSVNGIFWYEPAIFNAIFQILQSPIFSMDKTQALRMIELCFCKENEGINLAYKTHNIARENYKQYVADLPFLNSANREMSLMGKSTIENYLLTNIKAFKQFTRTLS